jgi:hypothetical protein
VRGLRLRAMIARSHFPALLVGALHAVGSRRVLWHRRGSSIPRRR